MDNRILSFADFINEKPKTFEQTIKELRRNKKEDALTQKDISLAAQYHHFSKAYIEKVIGDLDYKF